MREDGWRLIGAALIALGAFSACAAPDAHSDDFVGTWQYDIGSSYHYSCDDGRSGNDLELSYWGYRISTTSIAGQLRAVLDQSRSGGACDSGICPPVSCATVLTLAGLSASAGPDQACSATGTLPGGSPYQETLTPTSRVFELDNRRLTDLTETSTFNISYSGALSMSCQVLLNAGLVTM